MAGKKINVRLTKKVPEFGWLKLKARRSEQRFLTNSHKGTGHLTPTISLKRRGSERLPDNAKA